MNLLTLPTFVVLARQLIPANDSAGVFLHLSIYRHRYRLEREGGGGKAEPNPS